MKTKILLVLGMALLSVSAFGQLVEDYGIHENRYVITGRITEILFYDGHSGLLVKHSQLESIPEDGETRRDWVILDFNNPHFKEIYAMLILAQSTDAMIRIQCEIDPDLNLEGFLVIKHITKGK